MGAAAGPAAALSIASLGFGVASDISKGRGERAGQNFAAARAERAAEIGRIKADQTSANYLEELNRTLANIDAVRASAGADAASPTSFALKDEETRVSNRQRTNAVFSLRQQALEDESEAVYRRAVGRDALRSSYLSAGARVTKGLAGASGRTRYVTE